MPQTRKRVRDAVRAALADPAGGFNAEIAAVAAVYGITPFSLDWSASGSPDVLQMQVAGPDAAATRFVRGVRVALYTSEARQQAGVAREKGRTFSGVIRAHLDFHIEFTDGVDASEDQMEPYGDAVEDAVLRVLCDPNGSQIVRFMGPVYFAGDFASLKRPVAATADGYLQVMQFNLIYEVSV